MPKRQTPTAVRVARWTAIAAAITALGSTINTMWEKKPWFLGGDDAEVATVSAPISNNAPAYTTNTTMTENQRVAIVKSLVESGMSIEQAEANATHIMEMQNVPVMSVGPEPSFIERVYYFKEKHPIYFWLIVLCLTLGTGWVVVEYFHRKNEKKFVEKEDKEHETSDTDQLV